MAVPIKVSSGKYTKSGKVEIDGNLWEYKALGAGSELRMAQIQREVKATEARIKTLESKIDNETATEEDIDRFEELSDKSSKLVKETTSVFLQVFDDGTPDNSSVKKWLDETPTMILFLVMEDVNKSLGGKNEQRQQVTEST